VSCRAVCRSNTCYHPVCSDGDRASAQVADWGKTDASTLHGL
jgi:hypothetical protein